jgi:membrane-associated phospholipid phosphatase
MELRRCRPAAAIAGLLVVLSLTRSARGQDVPAAEFPRLNVNWALDGGITAAAFVGAALASLIPARQGGWGPPVFSWDKSLEQGFSDSAAEASDLLSIVTMVTPVALYTGQGFTEEGAKRALVYGQTLGISLLLNTVTKHVIRRPRPYTFNQNPRVGRYAMGQGRDANLSFYSGHASTTFAAAVSGAWLFTQSIDDEAARTAVWAGLLSLAGATAMLRTRAGKHFYTDVVVGSLIGATMGYAIPRLHVDDPIPLSTAEWIAIGVGPLVGIGLAVVLPFAADIRESLDQPADTRALLLPWLVPGGGGVLAVHAF